MKKDYQDNNFVRRRASNSKLNNGCEEKSTRSSNKNDNSKLDTGSVSKNIEAEVVSEADARLVKDHRGHFYKYLTKAFETMKSSSDNVENCGDTLYRTIYHELEASMRHTSHTI